MNGTDLLAEFRKSRAEAAFGELVRRYTNLVFSAAKRRLNNVSLAEEATQTAFINLAKAAPNVRSDAELVAWLHRTTINASIDLWRSESRRRTRQEHAAVMQPDTTENPRWDEIAPIIDEALNDLNDADRQIVLLRFFERRSMRDLGLALGVSEDAAKMRVSRAMEHLRAACGKRGAACAAGMLGALLTERAVEAAPAALALTLAALQVPAAASVGTTAGIAALVMPALKAKLVVGVAVVVGAAAIIWIASRNGDGEIQPRDHAQGAPNPTSPTNPGMVSSDAAPGANAAAATQPDPIKLLKDVARARNRIHSGEMEFDVSGLKGTNYLKLKACFDGSRRRFDSLDREYSYTEVANDDTNLQAQADRMTRDEAVQAGLVKPFESHHVIAYDGALLLDYWELDGAPFQTDVKDPATGSGQYVFDPRCLGISMFPSLSDTIESCLACDQAESVGLAGEESVEGASTWHLRVRRNSMDRDFWLEKAHPTRVLKLAFNGSVVVAKYDDAHPDDPIPIEITESLLHGTAGGGTAVSVTSITRRGAQFNIPVDPASWTLAGLDMKIGTPVVDDRLMRRIGCWNGTGLSDFLPRNSTNSQPAPDRAKMMAVLDNEPFSPEALDAAQWIISNTPDGPEVEEAAAVIQENHIDDTNLVHLCQELERLRPRCSPKLLQALLEKNPSIDVRGNACLALATLRKADAQYGANQTATTEAQNLFKRVIADFGRVKSNGYALADLANPELDDLRRLTIGKPAPETDGLDLDGRPLKLSDYRGQVVLLIFWGECGGCRPEMPPLLKLLERLNGKPFALVGVYCDDDAVHGKAISDELGMVWPSFRDGRSGPISRTWNNNEWPVFDIIDAKGIIRYRNLSRVEAPGMVDAFMKE
jgi:RNA polymerase sigma factor (sigma-70 family)